MWRRAAPGENPYPEVRRGNMLPASAALSGDLCRELLRQELHHASELLTLLEKALHNSHNCI